MKKRKLIILFVVFFIGFNLSMAFAQIPSGTKYYILQMQTLSGKVIGNTQFNEVVLNIPSGLSPQLFEFIPVSGKTNTYKIRNSDGKYLINSIDLIQFTEYSSTSEGAFGEWLVEGSGLNSLRFKSGTSGYLASENNNVGTLLLCDKTATDANGLFKLIPESGMFQNNLIDPGFENAIVEGTPLGVWINNSNKLLGNDNTSTQIYRSRVINNGYQSVGSNAFLLRFYGDANSYTKISHQLTGLTKGASYQLTYKYKQSNVMTSDATVTSYVTLQPNEETTAAIGTVFTSLPPATTAITQIVQNASLTFVAPSDICYVVFAKNPLSTNNYLHFIDDMSLVKTAEATPQIYTTTANLAFNATLRSASMNITGILLSDSISISSPQGINITPNNISGNSTNVTINVEFTGFNSVNGNITLKSGEIIKNIPVSAAFNTTYVNPGSDGKYYIQQRTGGKVIGVNSNGAVAALKYAENNDPTQLFEFIPVEGKENTYKLKNGNEKYLSISGSQLYYSTALTQSSEWILQGQSDTLVYITQASNSGKIIGSDSIINNSILYSNRLESAANSTFCLQKFSDLNSVYMFDPDFENTPYDAGPLGTWIPSNDPIQLGQYGYSRVQTSSWASSGKKCMYLRFLGEATSYNSISQKLHNLIPGATYRLDLKYKCQSTSATSLVNIYAATTPNAARTAAIGGVYATTTVASSNLATQAPQSASLAFVAPATNIYIVYAKNTPATNYNFFIDNLVLTETKPSGFDKILHNRSFKVNSIGNKILVSFEMDVPGNVQIELINLQGIIVSSQEYFCSQGLNKKTIIEDFQSGLYLVKLKYEGESVTQKIIL